jgi:eukaryotic-like serine/threonine-protein kinase
VITERTRVPPRYRLVEEVGQGGMAIVYRAMDDSLKREVAVKLLHPHLSAEPESKARLEREAQAVAKLKHDNILEIFDYSGSDADSAYIVTEFIDGLTLKQFLADRTIEHPEVAALITVELGSALAHAHGLGIIHRDVKPENVMIRKDGLLKLMDFGIAQVLDLERMTVTGQLLGSPAYMAPELIEGRPLDVRTDVFSLGVLMYQIATGALPFSGKNPHEVLRRITDGRFADARSLNRLCSAGLCRILARAMARDPVDRYPQMQALVDDLREHLTESGLGEVRQELRNYFRDPAAYEAALPARMTPALTASAQRHLMARASGAAIECWNRVLAYAPDDAQVLAALKHLEGRGRRRMMGLYAIGTVTAVALLAGLVAALVRGDSHPIGGGGRPRSDSDLRVGAKFDPSLGVASPEPGIGDRRPSAASGAVAAKPMPARPARVRSTGSETDRLAKADTPASDDDKAGAAQGNGSGAVAAIRTFTLGPTPQNVDVYMDGERQFSYDTDHRTLPVPWGRNHVIEFRSPSGCCFVERIEVGPDQPLPPENIIARKLKWKPARLVITTVPSAAGTRVMVRDPSHPGRGTVVGPGEEANIPFFATDEGQKEIEVSIDSTAGFAGDRVTVRAGERKAVVVTLGSAP